MAPCNFSTPIETDSSISQLSALKSHTLSCFVIHACVGYDGFKLGVQIFFSDLDVGQGAQCNNMVLKLSTQEVRGEKNCGELEFDFFKIRFLGGNLTCSPPALRYFVKDSGRDQPANQGVLSILTKFQLTDTL